MLDFLNEKNYLAMLAIPVLLSMTLGFANDISVRSATSDDSNDDVAIIEGNDAEIRNKIKQSDDSDHKQSLQKRVHIQNAIESNNYSEFLKAVSETSFAEIITEDAFALLVHKYHVQKQFLPSPYSHLS